MRADKAEKIISAAQRRFGLFGVEKTSMREIAQDLSISKASIYYYFPGKEILYIEVLKKEQLKFLELVKAEFSSILHPAECLSRYAQARLTHFRTLVNLGMVKSMSLPEHKPLIADSLLKFREQETQLVAGIIENGLKKGIFIAADPKQTASLYIDLLRGLRSEFLSDRDLMGINEWEYDQLKEKTTYFAKFFINGLKCKLESNSIY